MYEPTFHLIFSASWITFTIIRMIAHRKAQLTAGKREYKEGRLHRGIRAVIGVPYILLLFAYMPFPALLSFADFTLPEVLRWLGAVMMVASLPMITWIQWALGSNFDTTLHVREDHTLVSHGPYRWVRHPMYTTFFVQLTGMLFLTANWFAGGIPLIALTLIVATRTANEEAAMLEKFGAPYQAYMQRTGRFLPKLVRERQSDRLTS